MDEAIQRRWAGEGIDVSQPLPSDLILAAAEADPGIRAVVGGYLSMTELPASLRTAEPRARALYASGRRPPPAPGPGRAEFAEIVLAALRVAALPAAEPRTRLLTGPAGPS
jgi:hypothetical protein